MNSVGLPIPYIQDTEATIITSRLPDSKADVAGMEPQFFNFIINLKVLFQCMYWLREDRLLVDNSHNRIQNIQLYFLERIA